MPYVCVPPVLDAWQYAITHGKRKTILAEICDRRMYRDVDQTPYLGKDSA